MNKNNNYKIQGGDITPPSSSLEYLTSLFSPNNNQSPKSNSDSSPSTDYSQQGEEGENTQTNNSFSLVKPNSNSDSSSSSSVNKPTQQGNTQTNNNISQSLNFNSPSSSSDNTQQEKEGENTQRNNNISQSLNSDSPSPSSDNTQQKEEGENTQSNISLNYDTSPSSVNTSTQQEEGEIQTREETQEEEDEDFYDVDGINVKISEFTKKFIYKFIDEEIYPHVNKQFFNEKLFMNNLYNIIIDNIENFKPHINQKKYVSSNDYTTEYFIQLVVNYDDNMYEKLKNILLDYDIIQDFLERNKKLTSQLQSDSSNSSNNSISPVPLPIFSTMSPLTKTEPIPDSTAAPSTNPTKFTYPPTSTFAVAAGGTNNDYIDYHQKGGDISKSYNLTRTFNRDIYDKNDCEAANALRKFMIGIGLGDEAEQIGDRSDISTIIKKYRDGIYRRLNGLNELDLLNALQPLIAKSISDIAQFHEVIYYCLKNYYTNRPMINFSYTTCDHIAAACSALLINFCNECCLYPVITTCTRKMHKQSMTIIIAHETLFYLSLHYYREETLRVRPLALAETRQIGFDTVRTRRTPLEEIAELQNSCVQLVKESKKLVKNTIQLKGYADDALEAQAEAGEVQTGAEEQTEEQLVAEAVQINLGDAAVAARNAAEAAREATTLAERAQNTAQEAAAARDALQTAQEALQLANNVAAQAEIARNNISQIFEALPHIGGFTNELKRVINTYHNCKKNINDIIDINEQIKRGTNITPREIANNEEKKETQLDFPLYIHTESEEKIDIDRLVNHYKVQVGLTQALRGDIPVPYQYYQKAQQTLYNRFRIYAETRQSPQQGENQFKGDIDELERLQANGIQNLINFVENNNEEEPITEKKGYFKLVPLYLEQELEFNYDTLTSDLRTRSSALSRDFFKDKRDKGVNIFTAINQYIRIRDNKYNKEKTKLIPNIKERLKQKIKNKLDDLTKKIRYSFNDDRNLLEQLNDLINDLNIDGIIGLLTTHNPNTDHIHELITDNSKQKLDKLTYICGLFDLCCGHDFNPYQLFQRRVGVRGGREEDNKVLGTIAGIIHAMSMVEDDNNIFNYGINNAGFGSIGDIIREILYSPNENEAINRIISLGRCRTILMYQGETLLFSNKNYLSRQNIPVGKCELYEKIYYPPLHISIIKAQQPAAAPTGLEEKLKSKEGETQLQNLTGPRVQLITETVPEQGLGKSNISSASSVLSTSSVEAEVEQSSQRVRGVPLLESELQPGETAPPQQQEFEFLISIDMTQGEQPFVNSLIELVQEINEHPQMDNLSQSSYFKEFFGSTTILDGAGSYGLKPRMAITDEENDKVIIDNIVIEYRGVTITIITIFEIKDKQYTLAGLQEYFIQTNYVKLSGGIDVVAKERKITEKLQDPEARIDTNVYLDRFVAIGFFAGTNLNQRFLEKAKKEVEEARKRGDTTTPPLEYIHILMRDAIDNQREITDIFKYNERIPEVYVKVFEELLDNYIANPNQKEDLKGYIKGKIHAIEKSRREWLRKANRDNEKYIYYKRQLENVGRLSINNLDIDVYDKGLLECTASNDDSRKNRISVTPYPRRGGSSLKHKKRKTTRRRKYVQNKNTSKKRRYSRRKK